MAQQQQQQRADVDRSSAAAGQGSSLEAQRLALRSASRTQLDVGHASSAVFFAEAWLALATGALPSPLSPLPSPLSPLLLN
jgi:hypothetical protein